MGKKMPVWPLVSVLKLLWKINAKPSGVFTSSAVDDVEPPSLHPPVVQFGLHLKCAVQVRS